jgi:GNAT superfamily N-acetyltransferase
VNKLKRFVKNIFFDPFSHYEVDHVMFAAGLYVSESYRNRGIAVEMLRAREEIAKVAGIRVSSNVFSSLGAQKAALKVGFEENFSIKYKDLPRFTPNGYFPNIKDEHMKVMSKKFF